MVFTKNTPNAQVSTEKLHELSVHMGTSLIAQLVKNLPTMQETPVHFLGWEDPLEKGQATHSSILAWINPWDHKESDMTE